MAVQKTLSEILHLTKLVLSNGFVVLNSFFYDNRLGEGLVVALSMYRHCSSIQDFLLSETESVVDRVNWEVVFSLLLLARHKVAVGLCVHLGELLSFLLSSSKRVKNILC